MAAYLTCLRAAGGANARCRTDARAYLECRMERNLMARDEMRNLGFWDERAADGAGAAGGGAGAEAGAAKKTKEEADSDGKEK
jgi:cytochrome c oxidase assembly protein subunit 19